MYKALLGASVGCAEILKAEQIAGVRQINLETDCQMQTENDHILEIIDIMDDFLAQVILYNSYPLL